MDLIHILVVIFVIGILVWLVNRAPFVDPEYKQIISYAALVLTILWLVTVFFGWPNIHIGRTG